jgi:hypothetical protein
MDGAENHVSNGREGYAVTNLRTICRGNLVPHPADATVGTDKIPTPIEGENLDQILRPAAGARTRRKNNGTKFAGRVRLTKNSMGSEGGGLKIDKVEGKRALSLRSSRILEATQGTEGEVLRPMAEATEEAGNDGMKIANRAEPAVDPTNANNAGLQIGDADGGGSFPEGTAQVSALETLESMSEMLESAFGILKMPGWFEFFSG